MFLYVIIPILFFSITICNLLTDFPSYIQRSPVEFQTPYLYLIVCSMTAPPQQCSSATFFSLHLNPSWKNFYASFKNFAPSFVLPFWKCFNLKLRKLKLLKYGSVCTYIRQFSALYKYMLNSIIIILIL